MVTTTWASVRSRAVRRAHAPHTRLEGDAAPVPVRVTPWPESLAPSFRLRVLLAGVLSLLVHSAAFACLSLMTPMASWRWIAVQPGQASVALQATMASAPPDGVDERPTEITISPKPKPPRPAEESPLERALQDVALEPVQRQAVDELAAVVRVEQPSELEEQRPVPAVAPERPVEREELAELQETVVPLPRTDVGRKRTEELPPGAELSYPTPASAASEGAENKAPSIVFNPPPAYPAEAIAARQTGRTLLRVAVSADGSVAELSVYRSSGVPALDQAALRAVRGWRFSAAEGSSALRELLVPVRFVLEEP